MGKPTIDLKEFIAKLEKLLLVKELEKEMKVMEKDEGEGIQPVFTEQENDMFNYVQNM